MKRHSGKNGKIKLLLILLVLLSTGLVGCALPRSPETPYLTPPKPPSPIIISGVRLSEPGAWTGDISGKTIRTEEGGLLIRDKFGVFLLMDHIDSLEARE